MLRLYLQGREKICSLETSRPTIFPVLFSHRSLPFSYSNQLREKTLLDFYYALITWYSATVMYSYESCLIQLVNHASLLLIQPLSISCVICGPTVQIFFIFYYVDWLIYHLLSFSFSLLFNSFAPRSHSFPHFEENFSCSLITNQPWTTDHGLLTTIGTFMINRPLLCFRMEIKIWLA